MRRGGNHILTHDGTAEAVTKRIAGIVDQKAPAPPDESVAMFVRTANPKAIMKIDNFVTPKIRIVFE